MSYRFTKKELRIIEQTKLEGRGDTGPEGPGGKRDGGGNGSGADPGKGRNWAVIKPYIFFTGLVVAIVIAIAMLIRLTR